jgi:hAT family C-terminal dimerisation region
MLQSLKLEALPGPSRKRARCEVPRSKERIAVWSKFGSDLPELRAVALQLLSAHATSAATERNWSLWGRIYCAARSSLGMERAKALIAICAAERAKISPSEELQITLSVVEEDVREYGGSNGAKAIRVVRRRMPMRGGTPGIFCACLRTVA